MLPRKVAMFDILVWREIDLSEMAQNTEELDAHNVSYFYICLYFYYVILLDVASFLETVWLLAITFACFVFQGMFCCHFQPAIHTEV